MCFWVTIINNWFINDTFLSHNLFYLIFSFVHHVNNAIKKTLNELYLEFSFKILIYDNYDKQVFIISILKKKKMESYRY